LKLKYNSFQELGRAWEFKVESWDELRFPAKLANKNALEDLIQFRSEFAELWYEGWARAIRAADPNHLILGSRLDQNNRFDEIIRACGKYCDVISLNHYSYVPDRMEFDRYFAIGRKPMLIGEYGHNTLESGALTTAIPVNSNAERGRLFSLYTETLASFPYMIGAHYFQYMDEPITGRFDGETGYNGFVAVTDVSWRDLVEASRITSGRIMGIHAGKRI